MVLINGFPTISLVSKLADQLRDELLRLKPDYQMRPSHIHADVTDRLLRFLKREMPTIYAAYSHELETRRSLNLSVGMNREVSANEQDSSI